MHVGGGGVGPLLVFFCLETWFRVRLFFFGLESAFVVFEKVILPSLKLNFVNNWIGITDKLWDLSTIKSYSN